MAEGSPAMTSQDPGLPLKSAHTADIAIPGVGSLGFLLCVLVPLAVWFAALRRRRSTVWRSCVSWSWPG